MSQFHVKTSEDGKLQGPFSAGQLKEMAGQGKLQPQHLISANGGASWHQADEVAGLDFASSVAESGILATAGVQDPDAPMEPRTTTCPDCDGLVSKRATSCPHCGSPLSSPEGVCNEGTTHPHSEFPDSVLSDTSATNANPSSKATAVDAPGTSVNARFGRRIFKRTASFFGAFVPFQRKHHIRIVVLVSSLLICVAFFLEVISAHTAYEQKSVESKQYFERTLLLIEPYLEQRKQMAILEVDLTEPTRDYDEAVSLGDAGSINATQKLDLMLSGAASDRLRMARLKTNRKEKLGPLEKLNRTLWYFTLGDPERYHHAIKHHRPRYMYENKPVPGQSFTWKQFRKILNSDRDEFHRIRKEEGY